MDILLLGSRIIVDNPSELNVELKGKIGIVKRNRISDKGAWVAMEKAIPSGLKNFPEGDDRENHVVLMPEECSIAQKEKYEFK
jgi:hypothetical protein